MHISPAPERPELPADVAARIRTHARHEAGRAAAGAEPPPGPWDDDFEPEKP
jgi:hypothetical protein